MDLGAAVAERDVRQTQYRRRLWLGLGVALVVVGLVAVVASAWRAHFMVALFDEYRAGYAAVAPAASPDDIDSAVCDAAVRAAYPTVDLTSGTAWPDEPGAYWHGCVDRLIGAPADVWSLRGEMGDQD